MNQHSLTGIKTAAQGKSTLKGPDSKANENRSPIPEEIAAFAPPVARTQWGSGHTVRCAERRETKRFCTIEELWYRDAS
jgi:hypothetical protein